jgi:hypothetical protein
MKYMVERGCTLFLSSSLFPLLLIAFDRQTVRLVMWAVLCGDILLSKKIFMMGVLNKTTKEREREKPKENTDFALFDSRSKVFCTIYVLRTKDELTTLLDMFSLFCWMCAQGESGNETRPCGNVTCGVLNQGC